MAGSPQKREQRERLDAAEDEIIELLATTATLNEIASRYGVSRGVLSRWMEHERRADACARARARAADAIAERAVERAQETYNRAGLGFADKVEVAAAKLATDVDRWIAGIWNRDKYGEQRGAVTVNLAVLHLDALRQPTAALRPAERAVEALPDVTDVEALPVADAAPQPVRLEDLL